MHVIKSTHCGRYKWASNWAINQSVRQSIIQGVDRSVSVGPSDRPSVVLQSYSQSFSQSVSQSVSRQSVSQSVSWRFSQSILHSVSVWTNKSNQTAVFKQAFFFVVGYHRAPSNSKRPCGRTSEQRKGRGKTVNFETNPCQFQRANSCVQQRFLRCYVRNQTPRGLLLNRRRDE